MITRICYKCKIEKDIIEFRKDKNRPLGYEYRCKECAQKKEHSKRKYKKGEYKGELHHCFKINKKPKNKGIGKGCPGKKRKPFTIETRIKISISHIGKHHSDETCYKIAIGIIDAYNGIWYGNIKYLDDDLEYQIRYLPEYIELRNKVFQRDHYKDFYTGEIGNLEMHHIKPLILIIEENNIKTISDALNCKELWDINNCITLLKEHHKMIHNEFGIYRRGVK
jgi:hypothetical protein